MDKSHVYHLRDNFDYTNHTVVSKVISGKATGNVTVVSVDVVRLEYVASAKCTVFSGGTRPVNRAVSCGIIAHSARVTRLGA